MDGYMAETTTPDIYSSYILLLKKQIASSEKTRNQSQVALKQNPFCFEPTGINEILAKMLCCSWKTKFTI